MKQIKLFGILLLSACVFLLSSCDDNDSKDVVSIVKIQVAADTEEIVTTFPFSSESEGALYEFMKVKIGGSNEWERMLLSEISGFSYKDGNEYLLEVKKTELANPPADASSVKYELRKIIETKNIKDIAQVDRYRVIRSSAVVQGDALKDTEKTEIKNKILSKLPDKGTFRAYKFIYDNVETHGGTAVVYTGKEKEEGTFTMTKITKGYQYHLRIGESEYKHVFSPLVSRSNVMQAHALIEDVTELYKPDYPNLELALSQQEVAYYY